MGTNQLEHRRLLTLSTHRNAPGLRFRIQTWAPYLARHGIVHSHRWFNTPELERLLPLPGHFAAKAWQTVRSWVRDVSRIYRATDADAVLVYREASPVGPPLLEHFVARRRPMAFDIDDPIFLPPPTTANPVAARLRPRFKWKELCGLATVTICINSEIADFVRPFANEVVVIPNAIDVARYPVRRGTRAGPPVLGFSGSHSTVHQLHVIRGALERLGREEKFSLEIVGGPAPFTLASVPVAEREWAAETEVALLHGFDIGLAPSPSDEWSRYKYFVKVLLYMAVGLPVVASAVGSPVRIIQDGVNGFLARTNDEWFEKLRMLIRSQELREKMGAAARATIEAGYSLDAQIPRVVRVFSRLTGLTPHAPPVAMTESI